MSAQQLKEQGNALVQAGKFKDAIVKYQAAIEIDPDQPAFHSNLAHCYFKLKRWPEQEAAARQCLAIDATFIKGYYRLATALKMQDKYDEALEVLGKALKIDPGNVDLTFLSTEVKSLVIINGCAYCGTMNATKTCSICNNTYYCDRVCQREHWPVHKSLCIYAREGGSLAICASCDKQVRSTDMVFCDKCGVESYCSTACRDHHCSEHQPKCRAQELRNDVDKIHKLFIKYMDSPCIAAAQEAALGAMTRKQFMEPDPQFLIYIRFRFHPNYVSFVPIHPPEILNVDQLSESQRTEFESTKQMFKHTIPEHYFGHTMMLRNELPNGGQALVCFRHNCFSPSDYQNEQNVSYKEMLERFCTIGPSETLNAAWYPIRTERITAQLKCVTESANWIKFLLNAFRFYDRKPIFYSHVVMVHFNVGYELGQIDKLTGYEMMTIGKALKKGHCSQATVDRLSSCEQEGGMALIPIFSSDPFRFENVLSIIDDSGVDQQQLVAAECDREATKLFQQTLATIEFPRVDPSPNIDDYEI